MTTKEQIPRWFDNADHGARYMIVVCDTFDYEDYPVYVKTDDECRKKVETPGSMQRVMEVYDLQADKAAQMAEHRSWRIPAAQAGKQGGG